MEVLFAFICICLQHYTTVQALTAEELNGIAVKCRDEIGVTDAQIDNFLHSYKYAVSREEKCFRACFMRNLGNLNENGKFVKEIGYAYSKLMANGDANLEKLYNECVDDCADITVPEDICEAAETYNVCFVDASAARAISYNVDD